MSPMAETPLFSHVLTCDTFSGPALSPFPNVVQIVHVPLTCPCPCNQNVPHPLCTCFPHSHTLTRKPPLLFLCSLDNPTRNHSAPLQGSPLLPLITVQFRLAYVPSCSALIQHPIVPPPHFYAYLVYSLLSPTHHFPSTTPSLLAPTTHNQS